MQYICSSDGLIGENSILEIKCPLAAKDSLNAVEAVEIKMVINITYYYYLLCMCIHEIKY